MKVLEALDGLFSKVKFDTAFYKKLVHNNIEFITRNSEYISLFGGRSIGSYYIKYTQYDKNIFYNNLFNMDYEEVSRAIDKITSIPTSFKISRDDINLVCFYIAHRFLSNEELAKDKRLEYAREAYNYFNYRTLVLISSTYFVYPISEEKALTLTERLSNRYIIKKLKNWNEYCTYRSEEFINSKFTPVVLKLKDDVEIPNAINDLYNRTKDTLKNIYREFMAMLDNGEIIKSKSSSAKNIEGKEVLVDKLGTPDSYFTKIENLLSDKNSFIRRERIEVTVDIVEAVSIKALEEFLEDFIVYSYTSRENNNVIKDIINKVLINSIEYLRANEVYVSKNTNVLKAISAIVGNVLYARGTDVEINNLKDEMDRVVALIFKSTKKRVSERNLKNLRNATYIYIVLTALV